jgi:hypothetical protein
MEVNARMSSRTISIVSIDFHASNSALPAGIMEMSKFVFRGISNLFVGVIKNVAICGIETFN